AVSVLCSVRHARSALFPYSTLFRSPRVGRARREGGEPVPFGEVEGFVDPAPVAPEPAQGQLGGGGVERRVELPDHLQGGVVVGRSEEHTSELQSRENLVCRLLLEKK